MIGAATAPTLLPALKMPVARARSLTGNHSATLLMAGGKVAAFGDAQAAADELEAQNAAHGGVQAGEQAPRGNGAGQAEPDARTCP